MTATSTFTQLLTSESDTYALVYLYIQLCLVLQDSSFVATRAEFEDGL